MTLATTDSTAMEPEVRLAVDARPMLLAGWLVLLVGLVGFLLWAALAPLDKGVPVSGTVVVAGNSKSVVQLSGGQVSRIHVGEGQQVTAGEVLLEMNEVQSLARLEAIQAQHASALARRVRLQAEREGLATLPEAGLQPVSPILQDAFVAQQRVLQARLGAQRSTLAALDEAIAGDQQQQRDMTIALASKLEQRRTINAQLDSLRRLSDDRFATQTQVLEMERLLAQVQGSIAEDRALQTRLQRQIAEARLRKQAQIDDYRQATLSELAEVELTVQTLEHQIDMARYELQNARLQAPVSGTVVNQQVHTEGGFIAANTHVLDIVPSNLPLNIEVRLPVDQVDSVQPGLPVSLIFSAFHRSTTPRIPAVVETVSADRLMDSQTGLPYYRVQAKVTREGMALLEHHDIRPGMPVEVFIKTGERSLMAYLFKPIRDRMHAALTEE